MNSFQRTLLITRICLRSSTEAFSIAGNKRKHKTQKRLNNHNTSLLYKALFLLMIAFFIYYFTITATTYLSAANSNGIVSELLHVYVLLIFLIITAFSITTIVSTFFLSTDSPNFLYLPIKPNELYTARFVSSLLIAYFVEAMVMIPGMIGYFIEIGFNLLTLINSILLFFFLPFIPISIIFVVSLLLAKLINIQKHREGFAVFVSIITLFAIIGIELSFSFSSNSVDEANQDSITALCETIKTIYRCTSGLNFFNDNVVHSMEGKDVSSILNALISCGECIAVFALTFFLSKFFYLKTILGNGEGSKRRISKKKKQNLIEKEYKTSDAKKDYLKKERLSLIRSPMCVFQLVFPIVLFSVITELFIIFFGIGIHKDMSQGEITTFCNQHFGSIGLFVVIAVIFINSINMISGTAVSREGKTASIMKILPMKAIDQFHLKNALGVIIDIVIILILFVTSAICFRVPFYLVLIYFISAIGFDYLLNAFSLYLDYRHPCLDWDNEITAIKQNKNVAVALLASMGIMIVCGLLGAFSIVYNFGPIFEYASIIIVTIIPFIFIKLQENRIKKLDDHLFDKIN